MYTVKNFNRIPGHILNHFFLMLEKPMLTGEICLHSPERIFCFHLGIVPPKVQSRKFMENIFPARKSLVSDIPAGSWERDWDIFYSVAFNNRISFRAVLVVQDFAALKYFSLSRIWTIQAMMHVIFRRPRKAETALLFFLHCREKNYK